MLIGATYSCYDRSHLHSVWYERHCPFSVSVMVHWWSYFPPANVLCSLCRSRQRMHFAIRQLIEEPQNNFKIFKVRHTHPSVSALSHWRPCSLLCLCHNIRLSQQYRASFSTCFRGLSFLHVFVQMRSQFPFIRFLCPDPSCSGHRFSCEHLWVSSLKSFQSKTSRSLQLM